MVRTPRSHSRGRRFSPRSGNSGLTSHVAKKQNHQKKSFKWLETKMYKMRKTDQDTVESDGRNGVNSEVGATKLCTEYRLWILRDTWTGFILCRHVSYNAGAQLKRHSLFSPCALNDTPVRVIVGVSQVLMCGLCCSLSVDIPQSLLGSQPGTVPGPGAKQQLGSFRKEKALQL